MANPAAIITEYIRVYDGVDPTADNDGDSVPRRVRLLSFLNHINSYIHYFKEWEWTYGEDEFVIDAGDSSAPLTDITNFLEFGREGGIWDLSRNVMLKESSRYRMMRSRQASPISSAAANTFTITGGAIELPSAVTGDTEFLAYYRLKAEVLVDGATPMLLPDRYVATVLMPGLCFRAQESKNDARQTWGAQFREGLAQMCTIENPNKTAVRKMPLAVRGAW